MSSYSLLKLSTAFLLRSTAVSFCQRNKPWLAWLLSPLWLCPQTTAHCSWNLWRTQLFEAPVPVSSNLNLSLTRGEATVCLLHCCILCAYNRAWDTKPAHKDCGKSMHIGEHWACCGSVVKLLVSWLASAGCCTHVSKCILHCLPALLCGTGGLWWAASWGPCLTFPVFVLAAGWKQPPCAAAVCPVNKLAASTDL